MKLPGLIVALLLFLTSCKSTSEERQEYVPDKRAIQLNEEATDIIKKTLFDDSLNVPLLNEGLKKLDEAIKIDSQYFYSYLNKATIFKTLGHYDHALTEYEKAAKFDTDNPELILSQGLIHEKMGRLDSAQKKYSEALALYDKLVKENPDNTDFKISRAFLFVFTHGKEEALSQMSYIEPKTHQEKSKLKQMTAFIQDFRREDYVNNF
jgi:tetratricopeptide (TPR) repeat protein